MYRKLSKQAARVIIQVSLSLCLVVALILSSGGVAGAVTLQTMFPANNSNFSAGFNGAGEAGVFRSYLKGDIPYNDFAVYYPLKPATTSTITYSGSCGTNTVVTLIGNGSQAYNTCSAKVYNVNNIPYYDANIDMYVLRVRVHIPHDDSVRFRILSNDPAARVGNVATGGHGQRNVSLAGGSDTNGNRQYWGTAQFGFGLRCGEGSGNRTVTVYDTDNDARGQERRKLKFQVFEQGRAITGEIQPRDSAKSTSATVFLRTNTPYTIKVYNIFKTGDDSDKDWQFNGIAVGLPGDSIYGDDADLCDNPAPIPGPSCSAISVNPRGGGRYRYSATLQANKPETLHFEVSRPGLANADTVTNGTFTINTPRRTPKTETVTREGTAVLPPALYTVRVVNNSNGATLCRTTLDTRTKPFFNVLGGDINAVGVFKTGSACPVPRNKGITAFYAGGRGSSSQIAALANGTINGFNSLSNTTTAVKDLTFANIGSGVPGTTYGGGFGADYCIDEDFAGATTPNLTLGAGYLNISDQKTIRVNGNVYVNAPTSYKSTFDLAHVPMLKVIASGNIYISKDVTNLQGIFIAKGTIYTCAHDSYAGYVPSIIQMKDDCNSRLEVKGALIAKTVKLLRSFGDYATGSEPAETFNYTPETWLQALSGTGGGSGNSLYDAYTSLPPVL